MELLELLFEMEDVLEKEEQDKEMLYKLKPLLKHHIGL